MFGIDPADPMVATITSPFFFVLPCQIPQSISQISDIVLASWSASVTLFTSISVGSFVSFINAAKMLLLPADVTALIIPLLTFRSLLIASTWCRL